MEQELIPQSQKASYRRGTIMGLTAAEAFMLISFIFLLLLTWWFFENELMNDELESAERSRGDLEEKLQEYERIGLTPDKIAKLLEEQVLVQIYQDLLPEIEDNLDAVRLVIEGNATALQVETGLELESRFGTLDIGIIEERLRLMENERLRKLLESVQHISEEELLKLTDMASTEGLAKRLQNFEVFEKLGIAPEEILQVRAAAERAESAREDLARRLHEFEQIGLAPEEILQVRAAAERAERAREDLAGRLHEFEQVGLAPEEILQVRAAAERAESAREDLERKLHEFKEVGLTPKEVLQLKVAAERAESSRQDLQRSVADVARQLREQIGPRIAALGGQVLDNGNVVFPERVSFEAGSATIRPAFDEALRDFCRPWFEVLHKEYRNLESVQIEGHASSEFSDLGPRQAFDANLELSQRRALASIPNDFNSCESDGWRGPPA